MTLQEWETAKNAILWEAIGAIKSILSFKDMEDDRKLWLVAREIDTIKHRHASLDKKFHEAEDCTR